MRSAAAISALVLAVLPLDAVRAQVDCSVYRQTAAANRANKKGVASNDASLEAAARAADAAYQQCMARKSQQGLGTNSFSTPPAATNKAAAIQQLGQGLANIVNIFMSRQAEAEAAAEAARAAEEAERIRREEEEEARRLMEEERRRQRQAEVKRDLESAFSDATGSATYGPTSEEEQVAREACRDPVARLANPRNCAAWEAQGGMEQGIGRSAATAGQAFPSHAPESTEPAPILSPPTVTLRDFPRTESDPLGIGPGSGKLEVFPEPTWGAVPPQPTALDRLDAWVDEKLAPAVDEAGRDFTQARQEFGRWIQELPDLPRPSEVGRSVKEGLTAAYEKVREEAGKAATATEEWVRDKVGLRTAEEVQAMDLGDREIYLLRTEVLPAGLLPPPANTVVVGIQNVRWADESMQHIQQSVDDAGP